LDVKRNTLAAHRFLVCSQRQKGNPLPEGITRGYKYGDLALQVEGVSDETVKYGREFFAKTQ
jgi:hypothetical protein